MMSADVKASIKQEKIKDLVAYLTNFYIFYIILIYFLLRT